jgi:RNA polymerase sigma factor (TIGR02999 family)
MDDMDSKEITQILTDWKNGDKAAGERLLPIVYDELKRRARYMMSLERDDHTLQPTALVHEALIKLERQAQIDWQNRDHFYCILAQLMRQVLIDHARRHRSEKRGGRMISFSIDDLDVPLAERAESIIALDDALDRLEKANNRQARIVEMKFFGGMETFEIAEALKISDRTVYREWQAARLWLYRELSNGTE